MVDIVNHSNGIGYLISYGFNDHSSSTLSQLLRNRLVASVAQKCIWAQIHIPLLQILLAYIRALDYTGLFAWTTRLLIWTSNQIARTVYCGVYTWDDPVLAIFKVESYRFWVIKRVTNNVCVDPEALKLISEDFSLGGICVLTHQNKEDLWYLIYYYSQFF